MKHQTTNYKGRTDAEEGYEKKETHFFCIP